MVFKALALGSCYWHQAIVLRSKPILSFLLHHEQYHIMGQKKDKKPHVVTNSTNAASIRSDHSLPFSWSTFVSENLTTVIALAVTLIGYIAYTQTFTAKVLNSQNKDIDTLKTLLLGEDPGVFYCHRGGRKEKAPAVYNELHSELGSQMNFAMLNCSQLLPSGKKISDRFKLKMKEKPTIFATSPWGKPKQIGVKNLKEIKNFRQSVENAIAARAARVSNNRDFARECSTAAMSENETCIMMLKGKKFTNNMISDIEENLVKQFSKLKIGYTNAAKYRFSFEKEDDMTTVEDLSVQFHAIRQGGYYLSMDPSIPITWLNVEKFVQKAIRTPFDEYDGYGDISIISAPPKSFKQRYQPTPPPINGEKKVTESSPLTGAEIEELRLNKEQEQREKELKRREEMDKKMKKGIFEEDEEVVSDREDDYYDSDVENGEQGYDEEEDGEVMEL